MPTIAEAMDEMFADLSDEEAEADIETQARRLVSALCALPTAPFEPALVPTLEWRPTTKYRRRLAPTIKQGRRSEAACSGSSLA